jgi:hypothetical protein
LKSLSIYLYYLTIFRLPVTTTDALCRLHSFCCHSGLSGILLSSSPFGKGGLRRIFK